MSNETPTTPTHVYVLIGALAVAAAAGIVAYNQYQMTALLENPELVKRVIGSNEFKGSIDREVNRSLYAIDLEALVNESDGLRSLVSHSVTEQMAGYGSSNAFQKAVVSALPEQPKIDENASQLNQLRDKLSHYESQLSNLAAQVKDDESAQAVNQMQGQLVELKQLIGNLSDEVHCSLALTSQSKSNFLLKERRSTDLRGYDLVVTLGRIKKDVIDSVTLSAPNAERTQVDTRVVGNVKLGNALEFQSGGHNYEGVFTYRQARWGPDFVGFEVTETIVPSEACIETEEVAAR